MPRSLWTSEGASPVTHHIINKTAVERVSSTMFLGVQITDTLTWSYHTRVLAKLVCRAQQCMHFLRLMKKAHQRPPKLTTVYRGTMENMLTNYILVRSGPPAVPLTLSPCRGW